MVKLQWITFSESDASFCFSSRNNRRRIVSSWTVSGSGQSIHYFYYYLLVTELLKTRSNSHAFNITHATAMEKTKQERDNSKNQRKRWFFFIIFSSLYRNLLFPMFFCGFCFYLKLCFCFYIHSSLNIIAFNSKLCTTNIILFSYIISR